MEVGTSTGELFGLVGIQSIKEGFLLISAEGRFVFSRQPEHKEYLDVRLKMSNEKIEHEDVTKEEFKEAAKDILLQGFQEKNHWISNDSSKRVVDQFESVCF